MAEANFRHMIATFVRQTRPASFRHSKPPRYPQRQLSTVSEGPQWKAHKAEPRQEPPVPHTQRARLDRLRNDKEPRQFSSFLTDNYSRQHNYLRISVTERCNLRCLYCMPGEGIQLSPPAHLLTTPEIVYLSELFVNQGVDKIRLTGGEPTVRKDIVDLMHQIGRLRNNGLKELCITTNGISLHRKLDSMIDSGLTGVNLSLDTLDPHQFAIMTRRNGHEAVMKSIHRILEMNKLGAGIKLKINCVVMRGLNEREIVPFVELGRDQDLEVRFIEYMPFDGNKWSEKKMLSFGEMLALIRQKYPHVEKVQDHKNDTSKTYQVPGFTGRIGFITSMTHNFCGTCNRLRITSDGNLKVCLFGNDEVSLRDLLRESNNGHPIDAEAMEAVRQLEMDRRQPLTRGTNALGVTEKEAKLLDVIGMAVKRKEEKHAGIGDLENMKNRPMILIDDGPATWRLPSPLPKVLPPQSLIPSASFCRPTTPTHLLHRAISPSSMSQARCFSSLSPLTASGFRNFSNSSLRARKVLRYDVFRKIHGQSPYRQVPLAKSETIPTARTHLSGENRQSRASGQSSEAPVGKKDHLDSLLDKLARAHRVKMRDSLRAVGKRISDTSDMNNQLEKTSSTAAPEMVNEILAQATNDVSALSHLTANGEAHMVSIADKRSTSRSATATSLLLFSHAGTYNALLGARLMKGDALAVARIAGIQAAKKTSDLIPLAHPGLSITGVTVGCEPFPGNDVPDSISDVSRVTPHVPADIVKLNGGVLFTTTVACEGKTGVEMEAITAATVAGLTMYDMLKGVDKCMVLTNARVTAKSGGKSGDWEWDHRLQQRISTSQNSVEETVQKPDAKVLPKQKVSAKKRRSRSLRDRRKQLLHNAHIALYKSTERLNKVLSRYNNLSTENLARQNAHVSTNMETVEENLHTAPVTGEDFERARFARLDAYADGI